MPEKQDVYQRVTETIVEAIEKGAGTCQMPWHQDAVSGGRPSNAHTKRPYSGVNVVTLWATAGKQGYASEWWATYRQWQVLGAYVRKGEKGSPIVFYKKLESEGNERPAEPEQKRPRFVARTSWVFNSVQVEGYSPPARPERNLVEIIQDAETLVASTGAVVRHGGDRAYFSPREDYIEMPEKERFTGTSTSTPTESYYAVLFHELTHWTGHPKRLDRAFEYRLHAQNYAMEELVAELGAAFLCADVGVTNSPRPDHAAYVASWLRLMMNDTRAIFTAARKASEATDYVMKREPSERKIEEPKGGGEIPF